MPGREPVKEASIMPKNEVQADTLGEFQTVLRSPGDVFELPEEKDLYRHPLVGYQDAVSRVGGSPRMSVTEALWNNSRRFGRNSSGAL